MANLDIHTPNRVSKSKAIRNHFIAALLVMAATISILKFWHHNLSYFAAIACLVLFLFFGLMLTLTGLVAGFRGKSEGISAASFLILVVIVAQILFGRIYFNLDVSAGEEELTGIMDSLYFSVTTWTTLGYGDFTPKGAARIVTSIQALLGYVFMALCIAMFLSVLRK